MFYKKICTFIISIVCLILVMSVNVCANDNTISCCNTSPELLKELHNELIQKKSDSINKNGNISLFSQFIGLSKQHLMPSTGTVQALVVPITFPEHPISDEIYNGIKDGLFGKHQSPNYFDYVSSENQISVKEYFDFHSNGKMNFTGDILPVYMCKETPVYYDNNDTNFDNLLSEILSFYKTEGVVDNYSKYDSDNDGYIDCLILMYAEFNDLTYIGDGTNGHHAWGFFVTSGGNIVIENDDTRVNRRANIPYNADSTEMSDILIENSTLHECCHLMGLDDNYNPYSDSRNCTLYGLNEIMSSTNGLYFFNAYYRYLLDWIDPYVIPYEDTIEEINLNAYSNNDNTNNAIILVPD